MEQTHLQQNAFAPKFQLKAFHSFWARAWKKMSLSASERGDSSSAQLSARAQYPQYPGWAAAAVDIAPTVIAASGTTH